MDSNDREAFALDVETRTADYTREWLKRPGVKEKLAAFDRLVVDQPGRADTDQD